MRVRWHWKLRRILAALFAAFACFCPASLAQDGELDPSQPKDITANAIIERFAAKEREWKQLREQYTFRQSVQFQAMDGDQVAGEYRQVADISYVQGKRVSSRPNPASFCHPKMYMISRPAPHSPSAAMSFRNTTCSTWASKRLM